MAQKTRDDIVATSLRPLEDVQGRPDTRNLTISAAGVRAVRHPLRFVDRDGTPQHTIAECDLSVQVPHDVKGAHMSRFLELLGEHDGALSVANVREFAAAMNARLQADRGRLRLSFPWFVKKAAPVSGVTSLIDYLVTLDVDGSSDESGVRLSVAVPATSLCPCSKDISDYGAHNQRSVITITVEPDAASMQALFVEDLIDVAEAAASSPVYGVLKRPDEKFVTEAAYDNPKFVEDLVRDVAGPLNDDERVAAYSVDVENFESIHNHSAFARIEHDKREA
ncbi:MAG: GTP cyclohydrolase FolE2 [Gammaproteobacteria bacterium]